MILDQNFQNSSEKFNQLHFPYFQFDDEKILKFCFWHDVKNKLLN